MMLFLKDTMVPPALVANPVPLKITATSDIATWFPAEATMMPAPELFLMTVLLINTCAAPTTATPTPSLKPSITVFSMTTLLAAITLTPCKPEPAPLRDSPRMRTVFAKSAASVMLIIMPLTVDPRVAAKVPVPSMVIDFVIVTAPKPAGSRTLISPPLAVFEMAPAKVLHGAVRLQGFTSSPTPDTHVRVACAWIDELITKILRTSGTALRSAWDVLIELSLSLGPFLYEFQ